MFILCIILVFLLLLAAGMPVNFALGSLGMMGLFLFGGLDSLDSAAIIAWSSTNSFTLTAIPLFILMGDLIMRVGFSKELFDATSAWLGRVRGGLGIATIFACAIFAAVSGSSAAACASMGLLAIPEMTRARYTSRLTYGTMTAGGTLAILIPPSTILIVYGSFTEQSIAKLYMAGFIPGFILSFFYMVVIYLWTYLYPKDAPMVGEKLSFKEKIIKTKTATVFVLLMAACLGTIYVGIATPTEAAALGAFFTIVAAIILKRLTWKIINESLLSTVKVTCMVLFLILGGVILSNFLLFQDIPNRILAFIFSLGLSNLSILIAIYIMYAIMGCLIDGLTMIIITLPIVIPIIKALGLDLVWFGVVIVVLVELAQLTPPVGMNLFIIRNISGGKMKDVIAGSAPFLFAIVACLILITAFPMIVTYLPRMIRY